MNCFRFSAFVCSLVLLTAAAHATPIVYAGALTSGVTATGLISQPSGSSSEPIGAEYYSFSATSGDLIDIFGDRLDGAYDMSFWVIDGLYADTDEIIGGVFPGTQALFSTFGDDDDAANLPGPFGDPHVAFVAPFTGTYTVAVTNFASDPGGPFGFELTMTNASVPEPTTLGFLSIGAICLVTRTVRRRRQQKPDA